MKAMKEIENAKKIGNVEDVKDIENAEGKKEVISLITNTLRSFLILLILGELLPAVLQIILKNTTYKSYVYHNSVLVYNVVESKYKFIHKLFLVVYLFFKF